jgi:hypothetical protein
MTQTLETHERVSQAGGTYASSERSALEAASATAARSNFGTFAFTFGIAFAILYTLLEQMNWPLFTYHPAVGKLDFWMQRPRSGEGPPMYWYGWLALSFTGAAVIGLIATFVSREWVQRATVFCCTLAIVWTAIFAVAYFMDDRTRFDTDVVARLAWISAIPALIAAVAVSYFLPLQWAYRMWANWLLIMPIAGLALLGYSLKSFFLR